jgi:hypothetical protein
MKMTWYNLLKRLAAEFVPARRLVIIAGDSLPKRLPWRNLVLARDGDEDWCVGFRCPCGCKRRVELLLIEEAEPRWCLTVDKNQRPTLSPSVWIQAGCKSHLAISKVEWVMRLTRHVG